MRYRPISIGPTDLTVGTVVPPLIFSQAIPTVVDTAFAEKSIDKKTIGVFFAPPNESAASGELTFGGVDSSKYTGDINYVSVLHACVRFSNTILTNTFVLRPITSTSPASNYVGIDQSITYGPSGLPILDSSAGIVDTGTTLVLLASGT